ncbi:Hypothetical predicted protein [Podarcis lilfordi]|uniref:Uncharacterized protein n=1 Tax=Podarcis lilfordi TaxID=74358 RepID=A0AA35P5C5_9SAUR|nr:Hypothetical predicted protein [Podarcis lilfordi]
MAPALRICSCILRIAICHKLHHSLYVYVLWTGFSQDSWLFWGGYFCVLYYIVKGILAETLVFGVRGCLLLGGKSIFRTLDYFPSTPMYRKTKLRPQSRVLMKSTKGT